MRHDPHVGHADHAPIAGDPPIAHAFSFYTLRENNSLNMKIRNKCVLPTKFHFIRVH